MRTAARRVIAALIPMIGVDQMPAVNLRIAFSPAAKESSP